MEQITLRLSKDVLEDVETEAEKAGASRSEYLRDVVESRHEHERIRREYEEMVAELQTEVDELQTEVDRLQNEKRTILAQREEKQELVQFVEDEMERREQRDTASVWTRAKWFVFGREADG